MAARDVSGTGIGVSLASAGRSPRALALAGALALVVVGVAVGGHATRYSAILLVVVLIAIALTRAVASWPFMIGAGVAIDLLIPEDGRYTLVARLGFLQLEPYRLVIGLLLVGWLVTLLVDPRVRPRKTKFEGPLGLIVLATVGSELLNPGRVSAVASSVEKGLWGFTCMLLFMYLVVGVVRSRATIERLLTVVVVCGFVEAIGGIVQRTTNFNIFDHFHRVIPIFTFNLSAELTLTRNGGLRAVSSAGHPIELSNTMAMVMPLAAYLAISRRQRVWWVVMFVLILGEISSGSKTGVLNYSSSSWCSCGFGPAKPSGSHRR